MQLTNTQDIDLSLAVWLMHDEYDYVYEPNYISVTTLMKPLKQIILAKRIKSEDQISDVSDYIPTALGRSLHDSIEKAWVSGYAANLKKLGYPQFVINRVVINPVDSTTLDEDAIPIYLEQRGTIKINGYTLGGKFDLVAQGIVYDNKSTSAYSYVYGTRDDEHQLQGSLYRLIHKDKITEDFIRINYIFTDWQKAQAKSNPNYPQSRLHTKDIPLLGVQETEKWVISKLNQITKFIDAPEEDIPECSDEELWRSAPKYKYFSDPTKTSGRSTKNFDNIHDANAHKAAQGKGVVITQPGEVKRCGYCAAFDICKQKDQYFND